MDGLAAGSPLDRLREDLGPGPFRLGRLVLRDGQGRVLAATPGGVSEAAAAGTILAGDSRLGSTGTVDRLGRRGFRLPEDGGFGGG